MKTNPTDGAFAASDDYSGDFNVKQSGLTKREYFSVIAMQALIQTKPQLIHNISEGCQLATQWADGLIEELNREAQS